MSIVVEHRVVSPYYVASAIIAAAIEGGAGVLLSEDFRDKHKIKGIVIKNPFI